MIALITTGYGQSIGPSTLNAGGGSATVSGNTYEWSFAEMTMVSTATGTGLVVTQGVLQPMPPSTGVSWNKLDITGLKVYPNPAKDVVFIEPDFKGAGTMEYILQDITGRAISVASHILVSGKEKQQVSLEGLAAGHYTLQVRFSQNGSDYQSTYKIEKLQ